MRLPSSRPLTVTRPANCTVRRAGPARALPLCPGPVARDELPRAAARSVAPAAVPNGPALEVEELRHRYGERIALDGVSLRVERGELFGLLGPNGGGKSTLFRILSTLLAAGGGAARVLGHDVAREPDRVRRRLGVVFQHPSVDRVLTVEENLVHHGHLYGLSGGALRAAVATGWTRSRAGSSGVPSSPRRSSWARSSSSSTSRPPASTPRRAAISWAS